jgi:hypothetical protein
MTELIRFGQFKADFDNRFCLSHKKVSSNGVHHSRHDDMIHRFAEFFFPLECQNDYFTE